MLHVTANDYSGNGGGGAGCCWTTAIVQVSVTGGNAPTEGAP
jgi:streptolysin S family bacteriocin protoxin